MDPQKQQRIKPQQIPTSSSFQKSSKQQLIYLNMIFKHVIEKYLSTNQISIKKNTMATPKIYTAYKLLQTLLHTNRLHREQ